MNLTVRFVKECHLYHWRTLLWHPCYLPPHPFFLFHTYCLRVLGCQLALFVKARQRSWEGHNFLLIWRCRLPARLSAAIDCFWSESMIDQDGWLYLFQTTFQHEIARFKHPGYLFGIFSRIQESPEQAHCSTLTVPAIVEINEPSIVDRLTVNPVNHIQISTCAGRACGALAMPTAAELWRDGVKP